MDSVRIFNKPTTPDGSLARLPQYYGQNVFDLAAMAKRLGHGTLLKRQSFQLFKNPLRHSLSDGATVLVPPVSNNPRCLKKIYATVEVSVITRTRFTFWIKNHCQVGLTKPRENFSRDQFLIT
jgi:hypothetical protein